MKNKRLLFLVVFLIIALLLRCVILSRVSRENYKSNVDIEHVDKNIALDVYYSGSSEFPSSVLMMEVGSSELFSFWNLGGGCGDTSSSTYCGRISKDKGDLYLTFPTSDCRAHIVSDNEIELHGSRY